MIVWVSQQASLSWGTAPGCWEVASGKWVCQWCAKLRVLRNPAMASGKWVCQWRAKLQVLRSQTDWHDHVIMSARCSDITSGSPLWKDLTPSIFPLLVSAPSSCRTGDLNSCPPDLELGVLTKLLASLSVSAGFSTHRRLLVTCFRPVANVTGKRFNKDQKFCQTT